MDFKYLAKKKALALVARSQRVYFQVLKTERLRLSTLLDRVKTLEYVILKSDVPYTTSDFPVSYPVGKDLDILVSKTNFHELVSILDDFVSMHKWRYGVEIKRSDARVKIRFLWCGILHYQIDCAFDLGLHGLETELLKSKVKAGPFFVPGLSVELLYRALEYRDTPGKIHHLDYIRTHKNMWDAALANKYGVVFPAGSEGDGS